MKKEMLRAFVPTGMLGYGFPMDEFRRGIDMHPDFIAVDSGSTDSGPQKLALGSMTCTRAAYEEELGIILDAGLKHNIPIYLSSAGGDGTNRHVDLFAEIVRRLSSERGWELNMALIYSDMEKPMVLEKLKRGKVTPCGPVEPLTADEVEQSTVIVAQMGAEPFLKVLREKPDIDLIITGRSYDPAPTAAAAIYHGFDPGLAWHMGKIMECGSLCAEPSGRCIVGELHQDFFDLIPMGEKQRCTPYSVAAHTLYEKSHPYLLPGPGGTLDLSECRFDQISETVVRVSGSRFLPADKYTVKLEGARRCGYRSICVAGIRDPILISRIDPFLDEVRRLTEQMPDDQREGAQLIFHVYGKNGVMGELEPNPGYVPQELCIIVEVAAPTQEIAQAVCNRARIGLLHNPYEGRMATGGNIALPFTPLEIPLGEVCAFNVYHLMEIDNPEDLFPVKYEEVRQHA